MKINKINIFTTIFALVILTGTIFAIANKYEPGETLDPSCTPGEVNCTVDTSGSGAATINDLSDAISNSGDSSIFLGIDAGVNDDGSDNKNTAVGINSLYSNTTGDNNSANGYKALYYNTTGYRNTANGVGALLFNTAGDQNIADGYLAGGYIEDGSTANRVGRYSIFLGANTKAKADGDQNEIVIGYRAIGNGSNTVTLGNDSIIKTIFKGKVGIGTTSPISRLHITASASANVPSIIMGDMSTGGGFVWAQEYSSNTGDYLQSMSSNRSSGRAVWGFGVRGAKQNEAMNDAVGFISTADNSPLSRSAITQDSGDIRFHNINGDDQTVVGDEIFLNERMVIRNNGNVGIGTAAPTYKLDVAGNTRIGQNLTIKGTDLILWNDARGGAGTSSGRALVHIGSGDKESSKLYINYGGDFGGGTIINYGNVGIGTTSPSAKLDVNGNIKIKGGQYNNEDQDSYGLTLQNSDIIGLNELVFNDLGEGLTWGSDGKPSSQKVKVYASSSSDSDLILNAGFNSNDGRVRIQTKYGNADLGPANTNYFHFYTDRDKYYFNKAAYASGGFHTYSDERLKEDIVNIDNALTKLKKIRGVYYNYKKEGISLETKDLPKGRQVGVVAQEVEKVFPEIVSTDDFGVKAVDYSKLTPLLIEAIKDLKEEKNNEIDELKDEIKELRESIKKLQDK